MKILTKKYQIEASVTILDESPIMNQDIFNNTLELQLNGNVAYMVDRSMTFYNTDTQIASWYDTEKQDYIETSVNICIRIVYNPLNSIGE